MPNSEIILLHQTGNNPGDLPYLMDERVGMDHKMHLVQDTFRIL